MRKFGAIVIILTVLLLNVTPGLLFVEVDQADKANVEKIAETKKLVEKEAAKEYKAEGQYYIVYAVREKEQKPSKRDELGGEEEIQNLYKIVMAEAENQDSYGQKLVASVVINRMRSEKFPNTITEVITQECQFEPVANGSFYSAEPSKEVIEAVDSVIENGVATDALYFLNPAICEVSWTSELTYVTTYRDHQFYR